MLTAPGVPFRPRVLVVDDALAHPGTAIGRAAGAVADALEARNCDVVRALSFEDGEAIVGADASLSSVIVNWHLGAEGKDARDLAPRLLRRLRERHPDVPVFMTADRKLAREIPKFFGELKEQAKPNVFLKGPPTPQETDAELREIIKLAGGLSPVK